MRLHHSTLQIDESALAHNFLQVKKYAPQSKILAMVKANAYGHGLINTAKILKEADGLGVACLAEAQQLREAGITQKIVLLRGIYNQEEFLLSQQLNLDLVVHNSEQINLIKSQKNLNIWLKINTGMNRLGFQPEEYDDIYQKLQHHNIVTMTHFASADEINNNLTKEQINKLPGEIKSLANSAGILGWKDSHADWVRPGLMLYGVSPFKNTTGLDYDLKPVMHWTSQLINIRQQKKGEGIGYNSKFVCPHDMTVGIVGVGYGDGYPRHARNGTPILVNKCETVVLGRVSMDMLAVNLEPIKNPKIGDEVILWGKGLPIERIAEKTASNAYELLCNVRRRE